MKLLSWNVNGIRAAAKKGFEDFLLEHSPDIICLQEIKVHNDNLPEAIVQIGKAIMGIGMAPSGRATVEPQR